MVRAPETERLVDALEQYDLAIANRFSDRNRHGGQPPRRRLMSRAVRWWVRWGLGLRYQDTQCGAKAYPGRRVEGHSPQVASKRLDLRPGPAHVGRASRIEGGRGAGSVATRGGRVQGPAMAGKPGATRLHPPAPTLGRTAQAPQPVTARGRLLRSAHKPRTAYLREPLPPPRWAATHGCPACC